MNRRTLSICLVLSLFVLSLSLFSTRTQAQTLTPTATGVLPDLVVSNIYWSPSRPTLGQTLTLTVVIKNTGSGSSPAGVIHDVRISAYGITPVTIMSTSYTQSIAPGAFATIQATWYPTIGADYTISAQVDSGQRISESNEGNNSFTASSMILLKPTQIAPTLTRTLTPVISLTPTLTRSLTPTFTPTITPTGVANQPDLLYPATPNWIWDPNAYDSTKACYNYIPGLVWNVQVKNGGATAAGSFVVNQNYSQQQTVSGLPAGQTITLYFPFRGARPTPPAGQPTLSPGYDSFMADYTNLVVESNETNNTVLSSPMLAFTPTPNGGPTRVFCNAGTPTPTPTITLSPTRTNTPTIGPSLTRTRTPTPTPTCGACSALRVQVLSSGADNTQQTAFNFKVVNLGPAQSNISVRIYFTLDGIQAASNYVMEKYYDQSGAATISGPTLASGSNYYFTVNYGTATLGTGSSWEFQTVLHLADWSSNYSGVNDWWHTTGTLPTSYTDWTTIPAYANGTRVWGSIQP